MSKVRKPSKPFKMAHLDQTFENYIAHACHIYFGSCWTSTCNNHHEQVKTLHSQSPTGISNRWHSGYFRIDKWIIKHREDFNWWIVPHIISIIHGAFTWSSSLVECATDQARPCPSFFLSLLRSVSYRLCNWPQWCMMDSTGQLWQWQAQHRLNGIQWHQFDGPKKHLICIWYIVGACMHVCACCWVLVVGLLGIPPKTLWAGMAHSNLAKRWESVPSIRDKARRLELATC